jgi:ATP-dependent DNA helicase DinG
MNYFRARVGMDQEGVVEKVLTSPFDYRKNSLIYVPKNIPIIQGSATDDNSVSMFATEIAALTAISGGRAMVLCTSFAMLRKLVPLLRERCDGLDVVAQGEDLQRHQMVERLKANPKTILVGSDASFGQGIDLRGDVLQLVVIVRIPFPNPLNPIVEARCDQLGQRWFMDYSVPEAVTSFKQSFGRLIRSSTDIGCVAIMDSRVVRKPYGRIFLSSLPATPICYDIPSVEEFFVGRRNHRGE